MMIKYIDDVVGVLQYVCVEDKMDVSENVEILEYSNNIYINKEGGEDKFIDKACEMKTPMMQLTL